MKTQLQTDRLDLRVFGEDDIDALQAIFSDPASGRPGTGPHTSREQTEGWLHNRQTVLRQHGLAWYAVRLRGKAELLGNCGMLLTRATVEEPEIGYLINAEARGRGYATEAARAVIEECAAFGLERIWATIRPANSASVSVAERSGFQLDRRETDEKGAIDYYVLALGNTSRTE